MPNYANGKIYKIVCNITGEQYIGATTQKLSQRLTCHVSKKNTDKLYKSKDIILRGDYQIVLIENYPCNNKEELERKEREHIEANICVNKYIPTRTREEYIETNRELILLRGKEWYEKNKGWGKEYRESHKEEIKLKKKEYYNKNRESLILKQQEYKNSHKEDIALRSKEWYNANKDEYNKKRRERYHKKKQEKMEEVEPLI
jgi:hypothetical protein